MVREDVVGRDMVTTFRVQELGNHAFVTIRTTWTPAGGINGFLERRFAPRMLRDVYREELQLLQAYARELDGYGASPRPAHRWPPPADATPQRRRPAPRGSGPLRRVAGNGGG